MELAHFEKLINSDKITWNLSKECVQTQMHENGNDPTIRPFLFCDCFKMISFLCGLQCNAKESALVTYFKCVQSKWVWFHLIFKDVQLVTVKAMLHLSYYIMPTSLFYYMNGICYKFATNHKKINPWKFCEKKITINKVIQHLMKVSTPIDYKKDMVSANIE